MIRIKEEIKKEEHVVVCPFCQSEQVHRISGFGRAQLVEQLRCSDCKSVFERIKWQ
ncbi:transposase [Fodinisporobacter ferrooxydans]|uniref:Transposase n=1 Tax=Fodinisporobacter ferrooxydans TaxID=2901836 RepID=A0ABY4CN58_9BACL|nr:transposase [Alicyclobacillaceae bacterium MYW30-H2]